MSREFTLGDENYLITLEHDNLYRIAKDIDGTYMFWSMINGKDIDEAVLNFLMRENNFSISENKIMITFEN